MRGKTIVQAFRTPPKLFLDSSRNFKSFCDIWRELLKVFCVPGEERFGHRRNRGIGSGFVNINTGYFGLCIRRALRHDGEFRKWIVHSSLDCNQMGCTSIRLKPDPAPTRRLIVGGQEMNRRSLQNGGLLPNWAIFRQRPVSQGLSWV